MSEVSNLRLARFANFDMEELVNLVKAIKMAVTRDTQIPVSVREFYQLCRLISEIQEEVVARNQVTEKPPKEALNIEYDPNAGSE